MVLQYIRSIIFNVVIYVALGIVGIVYIPYAIYSSDGAFAAAKMWCRIVRFCAKWICNLETEVRGTPPDDEVLIAAKHQSFLDIILIFSAVPRGKFIMKKELIWAPVVGQYGLRMGAVPVARGQRGRAIAKMKADVAKGRAEPGQLIIYPQGTRVAVDAVKPYKKGSGILYEQLGQDCVPVATNVGHFWPRHGLLRKPGLAVVEFGERIPAGLPVREFMARLEEDVERESLRLLEEARGR